MSVKTPLIYVWLGKKIPSWTYKSLLFTAKKNKNRDLIFLTDFFHNKIDLENLKLKNLEVYLIDGKKEFQILSSKSLIKNDFWIRCSLRFEIIKEFINKRNINKFFHAELDNILFNFSSLENIFDKIGNGIFAPRDAIDRAIASFIYCNNKNCLDDIINIYMDKNLKIENDMYALGYYARNNKKFFSLPTESFIYNSTKWDVLSPDICGGIFDAAALGQYFLGIDPIISRYKPTRNLFKNENSKIDFKDLFIEIFEKNIYLKFKKNNLKYKLFNIHVHAKRIDKAEEILNKGKIFKSINLKKSIFINDKYKLFLGIFIKLFDISKTIIKKIIRLLKCF